jgi:hypothetical protein
VWLHCLPIISSKFPSVVLPSYQSNAADTTAADTAAAAAHALDMTQCLLQPNTNAAGRGINMTSAATAAAAAVLLLLLPLLCPVLRLAHSIVYLSLKLSS